MLGPALLKRKLNRKFQVGHMSCRAGQGDVNFSHDQGIKSECKHSV